MVQTLPKPVRQAQDKPQQIRPWHRYREEKQWKLLQPGWAGTLDDAELQFILTKLQTDPVLAYWWGFRGATKRRPIDAIKAVAMYGNPDVRGDNVKLVRKHGAPAAKQMAFPWG
jgi:hypothetical protein